MIRYLTLLLLIGFFLLAGTANAGPEEGAKLFKANCQACHHLEMRLVGPPLKGVTERRSEEWLYSFIKSSSSMIESGDTTAINLFNTYNQVPMPNQNLTDDEIASILEYIQQKDVSASSDPFPRPTVVKANNKPLKFSDFRFWIIYTITVVLTIIAVYYKAEIASLQKKVDGEPSEES